MELARNAEGAWALKQPMEAAADQGSSEALASQVLAMQDTFIAEMLDDARGSVRDEPDCVRFDVVQDEKEPNRIYLCEVYTDRAAFAYHMTTPHFLKWKEATQDWFAAPPVVGAGESIFPSNADWNKNWKAR